MCQPSCSSVARSWRRRGNIRAVATGRADRKPAQPDLLRGTARPLLCCELFLVEALNVPHDVVQAIFDGEVSGVETMQLRFWQIAQVRLAGPIARPSAVTDRTEVNTSASTLLCLNGFIRILGART